MRHLSPFEQHVVDAGPGEVVAHGEPTGAGSDDHDRRMHCQALRRAWRCQATVTCTVVGLVTMSKTAERFWDCATMASMSAGLASASMSYLTSMRSKPLRTSASIPEDALEVHFGLHGCGHRAQLNRRGWWPRWPHLR